MLLMDVGDCDSCPLDNDCPRLMHGDPDLYAPCDTTKHLDMEVEAVRRSLYTMVEEATIRQERERQRELDEAERKREISRTRRQTNWENRNENNHIKALKKYIDGAQYRRQSIISRNTVNNLMRGIPRMK